MTLRTIWSNLIALSLIAWMPWSPAGLLHPGVAAAQETPALAGKTQQAAFSPEIHFPERQDASPSLIELGRLWQQAGGNVEQTVWVQPRLTFPKVERAPLPEAAPVDPLLDLQSSAPDSAAQMPDPRFNFEGLSNLNLVLPPDTNGDIGPEHYVQWTNLSLAVWRIDRAAGTAKQISGPQSGNAMWAGFGGQCEIRNDGDPIVLYDHLAGRWFVSQFAVNGPFGPFYQCIAVSQTGDPTGGWYRYEYKISNTKMNDYPHFGVWRDGYYMTANQFVGNSYAGALAAAFEREKMLAGLPARMVIFDLYTINPDFSGMLPADLDGPPPPAGTPNYFVEADDSTWIGPSDALRIWEFHVDWNDPARSTFGLSGGPNYILPSADFTPICPLTQNCIPQPGTSARLDAIGDRLMHRLQYRDFGTHQSLVSNFTVDAGGRAGIRWFELRKQGGAWSIYQQGTYTGQGADTDHRWMGSAAMDKLGNLAIGFSISGPTRYPAIHYAGRMAGDPQGEMSQGEGGLIEGAGSQEHKSGRWGDYSMLAVDPVDDCTFWYTSEYYPRSSTVAWQTRIGAFVLPSCLAAQTGNLQGRVTNASTGQPLAGALVKANDLSTQTDANGIYQFFNLPVGTYTVEAAIYGYQPGSAEVEISTSTSLTQDFALESLARATLSGTVHDGSGQGWPLYARLQIDTPLSSRTVFTDPVSGAYQVELAAGIPHSFAISAVLPGYLPVTETITPTLDAAVQDFTLEVDPASCQAPGYDSAQDCSPIQGGLLVGNVYDANTGAGINGATVSDGTGANSTDTAATPQDPQLADGFYTLFSSQTGNVQFTAREENYGSQTKAAAIAPGSVTQLDFTLTAGRLVVDRESIHARISNLRGSTYSIALTNSGTDTATFTLAEVDAPLPTAERTGPFAPATRHTSPKHLHDLNASFVYEYNPPEAAALAAGEVLNSRPAGTSAPWGVGYDAAAGELWVSSTQAGGGEDRIFKAADPAAGIALDLTSQGALFAADMAFNPRTGKFWQAWVGGSNCIKEFDPEFLALTGREICPSFDNSQRGLAYNPLDDTFYSGGWTSGILYHFDTSGAILESIDTRLNISGLSFNPATRHLFVLTNADRGFDIYVLDAARDYAVIGGFDIPGLEAFQQGGLELDCSGSLWAANQSTGQIIEAESGETNACEWSDISWLSAAPTSGSLPPGGSVAISVDISPYADVFSAREAQLVIYSSTPYGPIVIPVLPDPVYEMILPYVPNGL